ncbi:MAG: DUF1289 domain-containing protein [Rhodobacteraceae bacterium]|nr:DUF1289 domain-containing protein [Paracoccaceae bacterium]
MNTPADRGPVSTCRGPPSSCIHVCKVKRDAHCIGCSMTMARKSPFKGRMLAGPGAVAAGQTYNRTGLAGQIAASRTESYHAVGYRCNAAQNAGMCRAAAQICSIACILQRLFAVRPPLRASPPSWQVQ